MKTLPFNLRERGFTLVEAVLVIVIIGIVSAIVAVFIRMPVQGYADSVGRAELTDQADLAMQRMSRDLRRALPNSISVANGSAIEFLLTRAGGRYLSVEDGATSGFPLDFQNPDNLEFSVVGAMPSLTDRVAPGDYIVVNNQDRGSGPNDAYQFKSDCSQCNIARIATNGVIKTGSVVTSIKLANNPFPKQLPSPSPSPGQRFQVVSGPVSYVCEPDGNGAFTLFRYSGYEISATQPLPTPTGATLLKVPLATRVDRCNNLFRYDQGAQRVGMVIITLSLRARNAGDPAIRLVTQVHVDNTP
jgi:MSHA biogenesis protein MshO